MWTPLSPSSSLLTLQECTRESARFSLQPKPWARRVPGFAALCLQLLRQHGLNEVFSGGVSSYMLVSLIVAFLLTYRDMQWTAGRALVELLALYSTLDTRLWAVSVRRGGLIRCTELGMRGMQIAGVVHLYRLHSARRRSALIHDLAWQIGQR